jgi:multidrug efflux pump
MYIGFASDQLNEAAITDHLSRVVQPLLSTVNGVRRRKSSAARPLPCAVARPGADDLARRHRTDVRDRDPDQQLPIGTRPDQGLFHRLQHHREHRTEVDDEFRQMVVKADGGTLIRLQDIGTVDLSAQSYNSNVLMNGQHAVFIGVQRRRPAIR